MTAEWREQMRRLHGESTARQLREEGVEDRDDDLVESDLRHANLDYLQRYDPQARAEEELQIRLTGEHAASGALQFDWGNALLRPLQDSVSAAAHRHVALELTGLSRGSTVMHVRPRPAPDPEPDFDGLSLDISPADAGVRQLVNLLQALEDEQDVRAWSEILDPVDVVVKALDRFDLGMGIKWLASDGDVRTATLTARGREYVARLRETHTAVDVQRLSGRITELRSSGVVRIKTGLPKKSPAWDVKFDDPEQLFAMRLALGDQVHFIVEQRRTFDAMSRTRATDYRFLDIDPGPEALPGS
ncbi:hypothetical protein [Kitasatospora phosalacinea]|uniref:Uncharacterized protein n=1 Tax=Kitasatospora phosalacinea TaxID=2065 RepID=A0A9W6UQ15_9ACTN|nr:hypothetical protein [Kitasatospora phosalacinea]GLW55110.1 hypothetical protein Kpho01_31210 [Kitasatospora phosalacinea]